MTGMDNSSTLDTGKPDAAHVSTVLLSKIVKRFPGGVTANNDVTIDAGAGEVHAVLGENGAGKTTLMKVLAGLHTPDSGHIEIDGTAFKFQNPIEAKRCRIGMVHQRFSLVPALTVSENLALSNPKGRFLLRPKSWREFILKTAEEHHIEIRPDVPVSRLSLGEQQRVEIFRLLIEGAKILILDEPTSILAPQESQVLFSHIRRLTENGAIVFLITHKIDHVRAVASRVSVLRRGELVASYSDCQVSDSELAKWMVGKTVSFGTTRLKQTTSERQVRVNALTVSDLSVSPVTCSDGLNRISFTAAQGEIIGVAGISGNGQEELAAAITGAVGFHGRISFHSTNGTRPGVGYIPSDRIGDGLAASLPTKDNIAMRKFRQPPFTKFGILSRNRVANYAKTQVDHFTIQPSDTSIPVRFLSGGNMQKVILARELDCAKDVLVAVNPTAGLDVNAVAFVHSQLIHKSEEGCAIILISEDLDELFSLCDRILVLKRGICQDILPSDESLRTKVGLLMSNGAVSNEVCHTEPMNVGSGDL